MIEFGREREGVDLSKVVLTHHTLKSEGKRSLPLAEGDNPKLEPLTEAGAGSVNEKQKALLADIIARVNDLFEGDLTDGDQLVYVNNVIKGKMLESLRLRQQASNNTKEQFGNSPDLNDVLNNAIMDALEAHETMSAQALASEAVREGLKAILLGPCRLYEELRALANQMATLAAGPRGPGFEVRSAVAVQSRHFAQSTSPQAAEAVSRFWKWVTLATPGPTA